MAVAVERDVVAGLRPGVRFRASAVRTAQSVGSLRIPELILGFLLIFEVAFFGIPMPFNQVAMFGLIALAVARKPQFDLARHQWVMALLLLGLFYVASISMFAEPSEFASDWKRRLIRLAATVLFMLFLASGRFHLKSLLTGVAAGMLANVPAFYLGIAPDDYGGVLSGWLADKNVAGLAYALYGLLVLAITDRRWLKIVLAVAFLSCIWLTESRTSIAAFVSGAVWLFASPRLPIAGRWALGICTYIGVSLASEDYSQVGQFSNRVGSDLLRSRIDAASEIKVGEAGFFGKGLGEAYVVFSDDPLKPWYFHNSYWSALVEGGWPWLMVILAVTVLVGAKPFTRNLDRHQVLCQAATVAALVCAWRLGEVLFTLPWAILVGTAMQAASPSLVARDAKPLAAAVQVEESQVD